MVITSPGRNSNNALQYKSQDYEEYVTISQNVTTTPGARYFFKLHFKANSNDDRYGLVWCRVNPISPDVDFFASQRTQDLSWRDVDKWVYVGGEFVASSTSTTLNCLFNSGDSSATVMMVDDLYLGCL
jgi:hypothetical protein